MVLTNGGTATKISTAHAVKSIPFKPVFSVVSHPKID